MDMYELMRGVDNLDGYMELLLGFEVVFSPPRERGRVNASFRVFFKSLLPCCVDRMIVKESCIRGRCKE